ncbi:MAG: SapC family protein [Burkholderiales bacterium]|nr:SapC family protein [Burkholderiales bacterium]
MQIAPPFGYKEVVAMSRTQRVRLLGPGEVPEFARSLNAVPVSYTEFARASHDYPIVFTSGDGGKTFAPVAVLGLAAGENLYLDGSRWASGVYVPAYVRRFPFCMVKVRVNDVEQQHRLVCIEKAHADDAAGEPMFDEAGAPLPKWRDIERMLTEYEADLERTREMCAILADYALLEPFVAQARFDGGGSAQLAGMHRVAEARIEHLNASQLKNLARKGILGRIYAHLLSLDNFARLLDRKANAAAAR